MCFLINTLAEQGEIKEEFGELEGGHVGEENAKKRTSKRPL